MAEKLWGDVDMFGMELSAKRIIVGVAVAILVYGGIISYKILYTPKNSLELYQAMAFTDDMADIEKLFLDGYDVNLTKEDLQYINDNTPNRVGQFTLFEYNMKSYVIMTSPGTHKLKVLAVEELSKEMGEFFSEIPK